MILEPKCKHEPCLCLAKIGSVGRSGLSGRLRLVAVGGGMLLLAILTVFFYAPPLGKRARRSLGKNTCCQQGPTSPRQAHSNKKQSNIILFLVGCCLFATAKHNSNAKHYWTSKHALIFDHPMSSRNALSRSMPPRGSKPFGKTLLMRNILERHLESRSIA